MLLSEVMGSISEGSSLLVAIQAVDKYVASVRNMTDDEDGFHGECAAFCVLRRSR